MPQRCGNQKRKLDKKRIFPPNFSINETLKIKAGAKPVSRD